MRWPRSSPRTVSRRKILWTQPLASSRLLQYEVWNRVHAYRPETLHGDKVRVILEAVSLVELTPPVLARALEPFPMPVRTFDALHLATMDFLRAQGQEIELVTYDQRLGAAARALGIAIRPI